MAQGSSGELLTEWEVTSKRQGRDQNPSHGLGDSPADTLATIVLNRAALTPNRLRGRGVSYKAHMSGSAMELDEEPDAPIAEEEEVGEDIEVGNPDADGEPDDSDQDAEGEVDEENEDDEDGEFVGAVKTRSVRPRRRKASGEESDAEVEVEDEDDSEADTSPGGEEDWEAADDVEEDDLKVGNADASRCV